MLRVCVSLLVFTTGKVNLNVGNALANQLAEGNQNVHGVTTTVASGIGQAVGAYVGRGVGQATGAQLALHGGRLGAQLGVYGGPIGAVTGFVLGAGIGWL